MKMKKMIGAVALTAALAMGAVPAFATAPSGTVDTEAGNDEFSDTGATEIKAKVDNYDPSVRATVPLKVVVVFGSEGGVDIMGPSSDAYQISNIGDGAIKLVEAELADFSTAFNSQTVWVNTSGNYVTGATTNGTAITSGNALMLTLKDTEGQMGVYLTTSHKASQQTATTQERKIFPDAVAWAEPEIAAGDSMGLELSGHGYFNTKLDSGELTDALCKIKYTIESAE